MLERCSLLAPELVSMRSVRPLVPGCQPMMCHRARSVTRMLGAVALPVGIVLFGLAGVASHAREATGPPSDGSDTAQDTALPSKPSNTPAKQDGAKRPAFDPIAERIKYLHDRLRITPAQEPLWANLAQVMRDNAKAIEPLAKDRLQSTPNRTAVETLGIYEKLGEVQMNGLKNFIAAFQALYDALSDQQKKIADVLLRTSPLGMVGSIPALPEQLFELPPSTAYASLALLPSPGPSAFPPYQYGLPYPAYPYYPPWIIGFPLGLGPPVFLLVPRRFPHRVFVPSHRPAHSGVPRVGGPRMQPPLRIR